MNVYYVEFKINGEERWTSVKARTENEARFLVYNGMLNIGYAEITRCEIC